MNEADLSLDILLQETLALTEYLRVGNMANIPAQPVQKANEDLDEDYLYDLADSLISKEAPILEPELFTQTRVLPESPGVIYKIDNALGTFCVRGYSTQNIKKAFEELSESDSTRRNILKLESKSSLDEIDFFSTRNFELAEAIREQVINRRFPHQEDSLCNLSDPGFSWWMNVDHFINDSSEQGRFEIFFRSHGINRAEKYIQLGPIGDGSIAALRMNQARTLLRSSFPISEFSCDDKSFTVASLKPDHLSFISFKNIFLKGENHTELENFPDNGIGRTLFYYFHELAIVRKFWIEVKSKLG
ncbi:MAG: hypothetical protein WC635_13335 [Bacteriovorax sp.]|jgi:hypothetical protein